MVKGTIPIRGKRYSTTETRVTHLLSIKVYTTRVYFDGVLLGIIDRFFEDNTLMYETVSIP